MTLIEEAWLLVKHLGQLYEQFNVLSVKQETNMK